MGIKKFVMNRLPASRRYIERKLMEQNKQTNKIIDCLERLYDEIGSFEKKYNDSIDYAYREIDKNRKFLSEIEEYKNNLIKYAREANRFAKEAVFADVFHDTVKYSSWLCNQSFSPGRWALGYPGLYVLYRILDEVRPLSILEMGLGQSTEMITQYARYFGNVDHFVTEHDYDWTVFFTKKHKLANNTKVLAQNLAHIRFEDEDDVIVYQDFEKTIGEKKFDLIIIDAPMGGQEKKISRIDILNIVPVCLMDTFIIMVDDYNRVGEQKMVIELEKLLNKNNIKYSKGRYYGARDTLVIASEEMKWTCSL